MNDDTFTHQVRQRLTERLGTGVRIVSLCPESVIVHFTSNHRDLVSRLPLMTGADGRIDFDASRAESVSAAELGDLSGYAVRTFASHDKLMRVDMADSEHEYRMMQDIAHRCGYQLPRDLYAVKMRLFDAHPERRPKVNTAKTLDDAATAIALDANIRLDCMTPDEHVECCQKAAKARPDLLRREYGVDVVKDETSAAPLEFSQEYRWRAAEKVMRLARERVRERGGDVANRSEIEKEIAAIVRENPSLLVEKYGNDRQPNSWTKI